MENKNELIVLEQLPIIKYKLEQLSVEIKEKVENANKLVVNEDTVKQVKQVRASLTKEFNELESQRKQVKQAIMSKYDEFEEIYKENVSNLYKKADQELKEKIDNVESSLKEEKKNEIYDFAMEYFVANDLQDIVKFEDIGLNITLSASMKSLKEETIEFCERIKQDIELIKMEEYRDEILYEYKKNHNFAECKMMVVDRHKAMQQLADVAMNQVEKAAEDLQKKTEETIGMPEIPEEIETWAFTIKATRTQVKKLKAYLDSERIEYE